MNTDSLGQKVIRCNVKEPYDITNLNYHDVIIRGNFDCSGTKITSIEGAPKEVDGDFSCDGTSITSLHDVHKHIKYIGGRFSIPLTIRSHVLGVVFIKGLKEVIFTSLPAAAGIPIVAMGGGAGGTCSTGGTGSLGAGGAVTIVGGAGGGGGPGGTVMFNIVPIELQQAITIINKYLPGGNIHECQEELIEAGFKEYARL